MTTLIRYFAVHPSRIPKKYKLELWPDSDVLPIGILDNSAVCYPQPGYTDPDLVVLSVLVGRKLQAEIAEQVDLPDPLSDENAAQTMATLDITTQVFRTLEGVQAKYPQTKGTFVQGQDEDGNDIVRDKMRAVIWAGVNDKEGG